MTKTIKGKTSDGKTCYRTYKETRDGLVFVEEKLALTEKVKGSFLGRLFGKEK